jgi:Spy/CpxP family protein refolding chaperone
MKPLFAVLALIVSLSIAGRAAADVKRKIDEDKLADKATNRMMAFMKGLNLSAEQKAGIRKLNKEYAGKFKQIIVNVDNVYTPEQRRTRDEAIKAAVAAKKNGKELANAIKSSVTLTTEQRAKMDAIAKDAANLRKELQEKIMAVLTPEQREQLEKKMSDDDAPREID